MAQLRTANENDFETVPKNENQLRACLVCALRLYCKFHFIH